MEEEIIGNSWKELDYDGYCLSLSFSLIFWLVTITIISSFMVYYFLSSPSPTQRTPINPNKNNKP